MKWKTLTPWKVNYDKLRQCTKKQRHHFANKGPYSQSYDFSGSHVQMWELDRKKSEQWRIDTFELWWWRRLLRVPWAAKRANQSTTKVKQSWIFTGRTDAKAKAPILWSHNAKSHLIGKDPDAGKDWRQEKRGTENEKVGWHHWLNGHELNKLREIVKDREVWHAIVHGVAKSWTQLSNWRTTIKIKLYT